MKIITRNRKANDYDLTETLVAGIMLVGAEIKSVCRHEVDLTSAYILKRADGAYLINSYIAPPEQKQFFGVEYAPKRDRKLLLNKSELRFLNQQTNKNKNIIPVEMFVADNGKVKLRLGVGTTLKKWDKRQKEREKAENLAINPNWDNYLESFCEKYSIPFIQPSWHLIGRCLGMGVLPIKSAMRKTT